MQDHDGRDVEYIEFPSRIIGGLTGSYEIECDVESCQWAEYLIVAIANGPVAGQGACQVNGNSRAAAANTLEYDGDALEALGLGGTDASKGNSLKGMAFSMLPSTTIIAPMQYWERITNSEKRVFVRIDAQSACSIYVSIRFRIAILKIIPGPTVTVHPDQAHLLHAARADAVRQRLGIEKEIEEGEGHSTEKHLRYGMTDFMKGQH